jgi:hypothetical protein
MLSILVSGAVRADESSDVPKPPPFPIFRDPYKGLSDAELLEKVPHLKAVRGPAIPSSEIRPETNAEPIQSVGADVEIVLPKNRCETGYLTWGSLEQGYTRCRVLGRGQTVFASFRELAGLRATQSKYRGWIIGETGLSHRAEWIKNKEHFGTRADYDYCMYRPDYQYNGASVRERPRSTIGHYTLDSNKKIHPGKTYWGTRLGSSALLVPVRMTPVVSPENEAYRNEGDLLKRGDFWIHSHENKRDSIPLETSSTFGCPRLSRACEQVFQAWVENENLRGKLPRLIIVEENE